MYGIFSVTTATESSSSLLLPEARLTVGTDVATMVFNVVVCEGGDGLLVYGLVELTNAFEDRTLMEGGRVSRGAHAREMLVYYGR